MWGKEKTNRNSRNERKHKRQNENLKKKFSKIWKQTESRMEIVAEIKTHITNSCKILKSILLNNREMNITEKKMRKNDTNTRVKKQIQIESKNANPTKKFQRRLKKYKSKKKKKSARKYKD